VVGSLLRPSYLKEARDAWQAGRLPTAEFKRVEDRAVDQAIAVQEGAGMDVATDGEMRRIVFFEYFVSAIEGLSYTPAEPVHFHGERPEEDEDFIVPACVTEKIRRRRSLSVEEYAYARARARVPVKVTLPSPLLLAALWSPTHSRDAYSDPFDLFADGAELVRAEAQELAALGCEYIQVDSPELAAAFADERYRAHLESVGISTERLFSDGVDMVNAVADVPGVRRAMHLCKGNYKGKWIAEGGYDALAQQVFRRATNFDAFLIEYDDERSASFEPLKNLPDDKIAVLGLVSTKRAELEDHDALIARIKEASRYFPRDQLAISTQCGFASDASGNPVTEDIQATKLHRIAEVAQRVWG
jgi:5-methyltetrahydropteroyltriglutamate--homocysteine methyltransferase